MKTLIIEDEKPSARRLQRLLENEGMTVLTRLHSVKEAVDWFEDHPAPDLIFLDIQLSDGLSFEIVEQVDLESAIIFTTAYDEYALKAFKFNSIDYLLKPIDKTELQAAIARFKNRQLPSKADFKALRDFISKKDHSEAPYKQRFTVKVGERIKLVNTGEIVCFYSQHKGTYLQTDEERHYLIDMALDALEEELDPVAFFRVNRKFIVHIDFIKSIVRYSNSRLKLVLHHYDDEMIIVSRERVRDFKDWLNR